MNNTYKTPSLETTLKELNIKFNSTIEAFDFVVSRPVIRAFDSLDQSLNFLINYVKQ